MEQKIHTGGNKNRFHITKGRSKGFKDVKSRKETFMDDLKFELTNILTGLFLFTHRVELCRAHGSFIHISEVYMSLGFQVNKVILE